MSSALATPKIQMAIALMAIFLTSLLHTGDTSLLFLLSLSIIATVAWDFSFLKLRGQSLYFPSAAIVSAIIIALLLPPNLPWYQTLLPGFIAMLSKNWLRHQNRPILNPAAFGLFISGLLFESVTSWWGVSFQTLEINPVSVLFFLTILSPGYVSMIRLRRYKIIISFLTAHILLSGNLRLFPHSLFDPTTLFFGLVMLPEPMTTPNSHSRQFLFGAFVATIAALIGFMHSSFTPDPFITGLLVGNLLFFRFR